MRRSAFTLAELLIVIAIIVVIIGIAIPVIASTLNKAHKAACLHEMRALRSSYMIEASDTDFHVSNPTPLLTTALMQYKGEVLDDNTYKAECGGTCTITYADDFSCILSITCSIHGGVALDRKYEANNSTGLNKAMKGINALFNEPSLREDIYTYYLSNIKSKGSGSLDSTGINFGRPINSKLDELGFDIDNESSWRIYFSTVNNKLTYQIYWSDENISDLADGEKVNYVKYTYEYESGKQIGDSVTGSVIKSKKKVNDTYISVLDFTKPSNYTIDSTFGQAWE